MHEGPARWPPGGAEMYPSGMVPPPPDTDEYTALGTGPEKEIRIQGSRFIGQVFGCRSTSEADLALAAVRKRYHDATHHCWALRVGPPETVFERYQDDGEPSGTAGVPILGALQRHQAFDSLAVVTRYFGGVKLGTGGLARAYAEAAEAAVAAAPPQRVVLESSCRVQCRFSDLGAVEGLLARFGDAVVGTERRFTPEPELFLRLRRSRAAALRAALIEATAGRVRFDGPERS